MSATKVMRKFHCCVPCASIVSRYVKDFDGAKTTLFLAKAEQLLKNRMKYVVSLKKLSKKKKMFVTQCFVTNIYSSK